MYRRMKRLTDLLVSGILLVLFSPVLLAAAALVKLTSPGPVFFRQPRGGKDCRPFQSIKFRTMRVEHVHDPREIIPLAHSGITPLGRVLRRTKIDELPQLFSVLRGDMSLVGPRPTIMDQVERYDAFQRRRQEVRPGVTGLAQVNSSPLRSWDERIKYDVYYVDHVTLLMDLGILAKTILVVLLGEERFARPFEESPYGRKARAVHPSHCDMRGADDRNG